MTDDIPALVERLRKHDWVPIVAKAADALERLDAQRKADAERIAGLEEPGFWGRMAANASKRAREAIARAEAAEKRVAELEAALEPFAAEAAEWARTVPDDYHPPQPEPGNMCCIQGSDAKFSIGDLRRARTAFATITSTNQGVKTMTNTKRWYLGAMNDGLFIIDTPPRPSTDETWHDRPDGPSIVLNVCQLSTEMAQAIVDAHNAALAQTTATGATHDQ